MRHPSLILVAVGLLWLAACDDEPAAQCTYNSDCPAGQQCVDRQCVPECREDRDCPAGACVDGACALEGADQSPTPEDAGPTDGAADALADLAAPDATPDQGPRPDGFGGLSGQVHFRLYDDSRLPVAEPVVYWTFPGDRPAPLTRGASCDCGFPPTALIGGVDGSFEFANVPAGPVWLVVQKGAFRRIREVQVQPDVLTRVPDEATALPHRHAPEAGDEIPRIVVGTGRFDPIEDIFAKLRLGPIGPTFHFDYDAWAADPRAYGLDLMRYQTPRVLDDDDRDLDAPDFRRLLGDGGALASYDFVFGPCADYGDYGALLTSAPVREALRQYVNNGGKLYVTDFSYDLLEQVWPRYVDFLAPEGRDGNADPANPGDPARMGEAASGTLRYASENRAQDPVLAQWLQIVAGVADGLVLTEGNWVNLGGVGAVDQCCRMGRPVPVTPEVVMSGPNGVDPPFGDFGPSHATWIEAERAGANRPHTLRFDYGCGEVMYSTYHTAEGQGAGHAGLLPQELVLLYLILEVSACNLDPVKE